MTPGSSSRDQGFGNSFLGTNYHQEAPKTWAEQIHLCQDTPLGNSSLSKSSTAAPLTQLLQVEGQSQVVPGH